MAMVSAEHVCWVRCGAFRSFIDN